MKIEIDNKLLGAVAGAAAVSSLLTAGIMHALPPSQPDPVDYSNMISVGVDVDMRLAPVDVDMRLAPVDMNKLCQNSNIKGYAHKDGTMSLCPPQVSAATTYSIPTGADPLPPAVRWAASKYGRTILVYELGDKGRLGDRELVVSVLIRRLAHVSAKHPSWTSKQLMEAVAVKWNPNKDKNLKQIQRRTERERPCHFACEAASIRAVENILADAPVTKVGKAAWEGKYTDFAHLDKAPSYYKRLTSTKFHPADKELKFRTWTGHNKKYFQI